MLARAAEPPRGARDAGIGQPALDHRCRYRLHFFPVLLVFVTLLLYNFRLSRRDEGYCITDV